jgi:hypothetical protein
MSSMGAPDSSNTVVIAAMSDRESVAWSSATFKASDGAVRRAEPPPERRQRKRTSQGMRSAGGADGGEGRDACGEGRDACGC